MHYDIFISYRRATGKNFARIIKPELEKRGFHVFLDFDELKDGVFDKRIMDAIKDSPIFLMILSKGALDRCVNENDWVRAEILYASEQNKHIVPVEVDKSFREIPTELPDDVKSVLGAHQFSQVDTESLLEVSMEKLVRERIYPHVKPSGDYNPDDKNRNEAEIHIDSDADCDILRFDEIIDSVPANKDKVIYLKPGKHKLTFVSKEFEDIQETITYEVSSENYSDILEVQLKRRVDERRKQIDEQNRQKELEIQRRIAKENERRKRENEKVKIEAEKKRKAEAVALRKRKIQESIRNLYLRLNSWLWEHYKLIAFVVLALLAIVLMMFLLSKVVSSTSDSEHIILAGTGTDVPPAVETESKIPLNDTVKDSVVSFSIGKAKYTGKVGEDGKPNGMGKAVFLENGDVFEGMFSNGALDSGKYVRQIDGKYYRGKFKGDYPVNITLYNE